MKVFLTGGTGFLGRALVEALLARGDAVTVVSRADRQPWGDRVRVVRGDASEPGEWMRAVDGHDAVVNLAGATIVDLPKRWTTARKHLLRTSRVGTTTNVVDAMRRAARPPARLVSQSATGYYGPAGDAPLDEHTPPGTDFMARLCVEWERAAGAAADFAGVARLRTAAVVGPGGGVIAPMLPFFRLGIGGPWGPGTQWFPWVHRADWVRAALFVLDRELDGPFNVVGPEIMTVHTFAKTLGSVLHRPTLIPMPGWGLQLLFGEQAATLLGSQRALPRRLEEAGFTWECETLQEALERSLDT